MTDNIALLILACSATAHYVIAMVMSLYARYQVKYLSIAWIMGIFAVTLTIACWYGQVATGRPGMLHPATLLGLVAVSYLQSIYPLSFTMPGYLQWERMWGYAFPAIALIVIYGIAILLGTRPVLIDSFQQLKENLFSIDIPLRLAAVGLSLWYIVNIFRLPHRLTHVEFPRYLIGYSVILGFSAIFYVIITVINYNPVLMMTYIFIFTALNLYLCFRTLESMALELPKPVITAVEEEPSEEELKKAEEDFNEANQKRFNRVQYWMQHNPQEWKDNTFGRDRLCDQTGINRHLLLQCVRSQGYYNVHEYINSYRIEELKRMILHGEASTLTECQDAGFGTTKTVRGCFMKAEGISIDEYLAKHAKGK